MGNCDCGADLEYVEGYEKVLRCPVCGAYYSGEDYDFDDPY